MSDFTKLPKLLQKNTQFCKCPIPGIEGDCWVRLKNIDNRGYGRIFVGGKNRTAYRFTYQLIVGPIGEGLTLDHLCRVRACINPAHLEPVTLRENLRRGLGVGAVNSAKTICPKGHPYNIENTHLYRGLRFCRACRKATNRFRYLKRTGQLPLRSAADKERAGSGNARQGTGPLRIEGFAGREKDLVSAWMQ